MAMPSQARLVQQLKVSENTAKAIRAIIKADVDRRAVNTKLRALSVLLDGYECHGAPGGVAYIASAQDTMYELNGFEYVNNGDTYKATVGFDHGRQRWVCCGWGDVVEAFPKRFPD